MRFVRHSRESRNPVTFAFLFHGSEKLRAQQQALDARFRGNDEQKQ
jgi:hypothetical protein